MSYREKAVKLYQMIGEGKSMDAVEELYDENVTIIETTGDTFHGKETQKKRLVEWQAGLEGMHGNGIHNITSDEEKGVTMVEAWMDLTFKGGYRAKFEEVAIQHWEGGKIVRERFYYNYAMPDKE